MTSRERWIQETRDSVLRAVVSEAVPVSASYLVDNLDCSGYSSGLGFYGRRSRREISAALSHLAERGLCEVVPEEERDEYDPKGKLYRYTMAGFIIVKEAEKS